MYKTLFLLALLGCEVPNGWMTYRIPAGKHYADQGPFIIHSNQLSYTCILDSSAIYENPPYMTGWNKLPGLSSVNVHGYSFRIGWRWDTQTEVFKLTDYSYLPRMPPLKENVITEAYLNKPFNIHIGNFSDQIVYNINGTEYRLKTGFKTQFIWAVAPAYFGGRDVPDHDIFIRAKFD